MGISKLLVIDTNFIHQALITKFIDLVSVKIEFFLGLFLNSSLKVYLEEALINY